MPLCTAYNIEVQEGDQDNLQNYLQIKDKGCGDISIHRCCHERQVQDRSGASRPPEGTQFIAWRKMCISYT